ncbi:uncharacterized PPE family protein PPE12-like [Palaemon carinicauda]|uniref:uncharacterized PPE family protein PPE12-like n=1 Tax=Palaemon carinicauda TaxID=392227 RepID=UPI0035B5E394
MALPEGPFGPPSTATTLLQFPPMHLIPPATSPEVKFLILCTLLGYTSARCLGNNCEDGDRTSAGSSKNSVSDISTISPGILIRTESSSKGRQIEDRNAKVVVGSSGTRYGEQSSSQFGVGAPIGTGSSYDVRPSGGNFGNSRPGGSSYDVRPSGGNFGNSRPGGFDVRVGGGSDGNRDYPGNRGVNTFTDGFINSINTDPFNNRQPGSGLFPGGNPGNQFPGNNGYPDNNRGRFPSTTFPDDGYPDNNRGRFPSTTFPDDGYPDNNRGRFPSITFSGDGYPENNRGRYPSNSYPDNNQGRYPSNNFGVSDTGFNNLYPVNNNNGGYYYGNGGYDGYDPSFFPGSGNAFTFLPGSGFVRVTDNPGATGNVFFPQSNNQGFVPGGGIYTMPLGNTGRFPIDSNFNNRGIQFPIGSNFNNRGFRAPNPLFFGGVPSGNPNDYPTGGNGRFFPGNNFGSRYPSGGIGFVNDNNIPVSNTGFLTPSVGFVNNNIPVSNNGFLTPSVGTGYLPPPVSTGYLPPPGK